MPTGFYRSYTSCNCRSKPIRGNISASWLCFSKSFMYKNKWWPSMVGHSLLTQNLMTAWWQFSKTNSLREIAQHNLTTSWVRVLSNQSKKHGLSLAYGMQLCSPQLLFISLLYVSSLAFFFFLSHLTVSTDIGGES